ncbi:hypothetical protein QFC19_004179 [Naganishia cerealis]|uniref:Uncharacterized protein n=1 Tax=Naganishia cerealis TaxID=610337 RepID=A0ACC2VY50_9TREE|nr:hypothetical protein QFC19_004179 [Naganishia cerealis]
MRMTSAIAEWICAVAASHVRKSLGYPDEVQVLSTRAFFWPLWSGNEIEKVHELDEYDFAASGQFGYHAWESLAMKYLGDLSPDKIRTVNSSFNKMVRPYIGSNDDAIFRKWKGGKTR